MTKVVIIGAGLSGLSAACHLAGRGYDVHIVEREDQPGGRNQRVVQDGFTFDTGATVMTLPNLLDSVLSQVDASVDELVPMRRLDPGYRSFFSDGSTIDTRASVADMRAEIEAKSGSSDAAQFEPFVAWLKRLNDVEMPHFIDKNYNSVLSLFNPPGPGFKILRLGGLKKLGSAISSFFDDDRLHRIFTFQALYAGMAPDDALAIYAVISYMDSIQGVWHPTGGMGAVAEAMATVVSNAGVRIDYGRTVTSIVTASDGRATGVDMADGERIQADAVVSTLDLPTMYRYILPQVSVPRKLTHGTYSPSAVVWHIGVRGDLPAQAVHHNIHFGEQWGESFDALTKQHKLMPDPSRLVSIQSVSEPSLAPDGCHTLYVLEPVPNNRSGIDWNASEATFRDRLMTFLDENDYPTDVVTEKMYTPYDWARSGMAQGTPFAMSHILRQTGPWRPQNIDRRVGGLVFAGSGTIPGVGVPMVLISGKLAADRVDEWVGRGK